MLTHLEQLCALSGVSGDEGRVAAYITKQIDGHCEWHIDALGSVIVFKKGKKSPKKRVLLCAHTDEVGFIITGHTDDGMLHFATVGGIDSRVVVGKPVLVGDAALSGVIGTKAVHMLTTEEKDTPLKIEKLTIDLGFTTRKEAEAAVQAGDRAVFDSAFTRFGASMLKGRAIDDRAGCAALIELICGELEYDTYFAFEAQEEVGGAGARAAAYAISPDRAIIVEATTAGDLSGVAEDKRVCCVGKGPVLSFMDNGTIYDRELYQLALSTAQELGIPAQSKLGVFGGNDARVVQATRGGVRCAAVSLPCRYLHSPCCVISEGDYVATVHLLKAFAARVAEL